MAADCIRLRDGVLMPAVGLGTFQGGYDYGVSYKGIVLFKMFS